MILQLISEIGPWFWFILGLVLLLAEIFIPGSVLVWFGLSALVIGTLTMTGMAAISWWPWQSQVVAFAVLSIVFVFVGRRLFPTDRPPGEQNGLNDPLGRHVGARAVLEEALANGTGRVRLGDSVWLVVGPDMPKGTPVIVAGIADGKLQVQPDT